MGSGANDCGHLRDAIASLELELELALTPDEPAALEAPYTPRNPEGF